MGKTKEKPKAEPGSKRRFERTVDYMLNTPPKPHKPKGAVKFAKPHKAVKKKARQ